MVGEKQRPFLIIPTFPISRTPMEHVSSRKAANCTHLRLGIMLKKNETIVGNFWNMTLVLYLEGNQIPANIPVKFNLEKVGDLFNGTAQVSDGMMGILLMSYSNRYRNF